MTERLSRAALFALLQEFEPQRASELRRIGVSEADQVWIHAGSGGVNPTRELFGADLAYLRSLPTNLGVEAYCALLGFDYRTTKRELLGQEEP